MVLPHIVPKYNVPVYGSRFTIGRVEEIFENFGLPMPDGFELKTVIMNENYPRTAENRGILSRADSSYPLHTRQYHGRGRHPGRPDH